MLHAQTTSKKTLKEKQNSLDIENISKEEIIKAFGGCTKCYGKGYSTEIHHTIYHADFIGEKTTFTTDKTFKPCSCDRGKQIRENFLTNKA